MALKTQIRNVVGEQQILIKQRNNLKKTGPRL